MSCEHCINRREFLTTAASAAGLTVLTSCGDGQLSALAPQSFPGEFDPITITVGAFPDLANLGVLVAVPARSFAVKRTGTSTFAALSRRCTHQGCITNIVNGQRFDCPCHGSRFNSDGAVINGPNTGGSITPLPTFTTSYDSATDQLTIT